MSVSVDICWKSFNKNREELCGDKVEVLKTEDSSIIILADGMGSGVKANILATLTSKILGTMFREGAEIDACVETIARTLPICKEREVAYATFSILQIFRDGEAYLVEYDNPKCVFIRNKEIINYPYQERVIEGKKIREYRFHVELNDCFVLMSDGAIWAGEEETMNYNWEWDDMAAYTLKCTNETLSAARLAAMLSQVCYDLYGQKPGDDTTVAVTRVIRRQVVNIFTGPPSRKEDDERVVHDFMKQEGKKVICGGTSANVASRVLKREIVTLVKHADPKIPPMATMEGLDLVTEGVLTIGSALDLLHRYENDDFDEAFFDALDAENGAAKLARLLIEECTDLNLFVGRALNPAHQNSNLPFDLSVRMNLVEQLKDCAERMGKHVTVKYY
ncbi:MULTISPECIES: SpoIIE family protein phosphatase [unclassified Dorea]|uniref:SpoIIE family protein phosphatase n=1 Tax=unclassified Dorea TaxID=2627917 RepID=UPI000E4F12AD|nr:MULTISPECIES: SpoIIE family protein phosphatase [unclassified Dorea]RGY79792.1 serine/threonine-protein phosphatase [Dorea sp. AM58-8]RHP10451.1 serine/threonine-protein phosphatase [Dorea sp. AF36-15AT]